MHSYYTTLHYVYRSLIYRFHRHPMVFMGSPCPYTQWRDKTGTRHANLGNLEQTLTFQLAMKHIPPQLAITLTHRHTCMCSSHKQCVVSTKDAPLAWSGLSLRNSQVFIELDSTYMHMCTCGCAILHQGQMGLYTHTHTITRHPFSFADMSNTFHSCLFLDTIQFYGA